MANPIYHKALSLINIFRKPAKVDTAGLMALDRNLESFQHKVLSYLELQETHPGCYTHFYIKTVIRSKRIRQQKLILLKMVADILNVYCYCKDELDNDNIMRTTRTITLLGQKEDVLIVWAMFRYVNYIAKELADNDKGDASIALNNAYILICEKVKKVLDNMPETSEIKEEKISTYTKYGVKINFPLKPKSQVKRYLLAYARTNGKYKNQRLL